MKTQGFKLELITPCFCGGAEPDRQAEIRAPSIRGQLRWWFRTLGGFKSLSNESVTKQEAGIFGSIHGDQGNASRLIVRVKSEASGGLVSTLVKDTDGMDARVGTDRGYLLFPLRNNPKAVFDQPALPKFELHILWRGDPAIWNEIQALITVFGNLGALGFRSRRAMGVLAMSGSSMPLKDALDCFNKSHQLNVRALPASNANQAIKVLAGWLKSWRSHGRTGNNTAEISMPGFKYAKQDHDMAAARAPGQAFRPPLGLPIVSKYGDWNWNKGTKEQPKGRFASPVLLRPHRDSQGKWHALVIFVDAHRWPEGKQVYLNGEPRDVSLDLYEAMKKDGCLSDFLT